MAELDLPGPPTGGAGGVHVVERVLARRRASCLESALVAQRWLAAHGIDRDVLVGVSAPGAGFRAHAWLHDPDGDAHPELTEIHRRSPRPTWSPGSPTARRAQVRG